MKRTLRQNARALHRAQLFWAASRAAANTALESKLKVLGQLLVDGLLHEDHEIHEARLLLTAIEELEQPHLRVLHHLTTSYLEGLSEEERAAAKEKNELDAWPFERLTQELGVSHSALELTVATLSGNNLVHGQADVFGMPTVPQMQWTLTEPGRAVLERFRRAGEEAAGSRCRRMTNRLVKTRAAGHLGILVVSLCSI